MLARRIKGRIKRRETDPAFNQFLKCSPEVHTGLGQYIQEVLLIKTHAVFAGNEKS